jgi:hypothetical protein
MELIACVLILEMHLAEADLTGFPTHQVVGTQIKHTAHVVVSSARTHLLSDFWWGRREAVGSLDTPRNLGCPSRRIACCSYAPCMEHRCRSSVPVLDDSGLV